MKNKKIKKLQTLILLSFAIQPAIATGETTAKPCSTEGYRQFDFWVGDWDVYIEGDKKAGTNSIKKIIGGCVIFENWQSENSSFEGKSFNTYNKFNKTWNQVWVDTTGATIHFSGTRSGNIMDMAGSMETEKGILHYKMSYTINEDGTVRQHWQESKDEKTWDTIFDGIYRKKQ